MLLSLSTTAAPATDLGYLLSRSPARSHASDLPFGRALVFFPEASVERCTAVLHVEVDPARAADGTGDGPYVASSLLSAAIARVFGAALAGRCRERPELARTPIPLEATIVAAPCPEGPSIARRLFAPLGWEVEATPVPVAGGPAAAPRLFDLTVRGTARLADLLAHLYVLLPVLDPSRTDGASEDEVDQRLAHGGAWLRSHPDRELVVSRSLGRRGDARDDLDRLLDGDGAAPPAATDAGEPEVAAEAPLRLGALRDEAVLRTLRARDVRTVVDWGCGDGRLVRALAEEAWSRRVIGVEPSARALARARRRLDPDRLPAHAARKVELRLGSATYADPGLADVDAGVLVEVIEHVDEERLPALVDAVFAAARPRVVVVTTPNAEHDLGLPPAPGARRHRDHRFEWPRATFRAWATEVAAAHGYAVRFEDVGPVDDARGAPTQLAEFTR